MGLKGKILLGMAVLVLVSLFLIPEGLTSIVGFGGLVIIVAAWFIISKTKTFFT
jgi:hypothetical protein